MRFEVPQFIEIEDKIFGPLTWRQFIYLGGGAGFGVIAFFWLPFLLFVLIAVPIGALSAALAFYPINNRPFSIFLESVYNYYTNSKLYLWKKRSPFEAPTVTTKSVPLPPRTTHEPASADANKLTSLSRQLELTSLTKE